jgi:RND family efflux transporter MFP subunit
LYQKEASSKQEYEEAESRRKSAEASFRVAEARVAEVQAKQAQLKADQSDLAASSRYVRIVAPFDGIVTEVLAKAGAFFNPGQTVVSMENPDRYQLVFAAEEDLLPSLRKDQMIGVRVSSLPGDVANATVAEISPSMGASSRTFQVKVNLTPGAALRGGLSGTALIPSSRKALWVPARYVTVNQNVETVLVRAGEAWRRVLVKTGRQKDGKVEILSGLNLNDEIGK